MLKNEICFAGYSYDANVFCNLLYNGYVGKTLYEDKK